MVTVIEGDGNPRDLTVTDGEYETHIKIYNIHNTQCVGFGELIPVETLVSFSEWLDADRKNKEV
jgi:hypothetical protein